MKIYTIYNAYAEYIKPVITEYANRSEISHHTMSCADFAFYFRNGKTVYLKNRLGLPWYQYTEEDIIMAKLGSLPDPNLPYLTQTAHTI